MKVGVGMAMRTILGGIKQADIDYQLIADDDRIAVGISGGKDSLCLLYALKLYQRFSKKNYDIIAVHIIMGFDKMDMSDIQAFCKLHEIDFYQIPSRPIIYEVLKKNLDNSGKLPCSICSRMKKAAVAQAAKQLNCNKVAFAHHSDDAVETLFMNMIHGGKIATFLPKMLLSRENIIFIRPLIYANEKTILHTANQLKLPIVPSTCPNDKKTGRESVKQLLKQLYRQYPDAKTNFQTMLSNLDKVELWSKEKLD